MYNSYFKNFNFINKIYNISKDITFSLIYIKILVNRNITLYLIVNKIIKNNIIYYICS